MSPNEPQASITIPLYRDPVFYGWIFGYWVAFLVAGAALIQGRHEEVDPNTYGKYVQVLIAVFILLVTLLRLWRTSRLELIDGTLRYRGRFRKVTVPPSSLTRLSVAIFGSYMRVISVETQSEQIVMTFLARKMPTKINTALDEISARTGHLWRGRSTDIASSGRASLTDFWRAWSDVVGKTWGHRLGWIFTHVLQVRIEEVGINSAYLRWGSAILYCSIFGFVALMNAGSILSAAGKPVLATLAMLILYFISWAFVCLGFNVILLFLGQEIRNRESIEADVFAARQVQQRLLPRISPNVPGLDVAGSCEPAREVGGDYFDYFVNSTESNTNLTVAVADVAGKGLAAGLLMTLVKGALSTGVATLGNLRDAVVATSSHIRSTKGDRRFVTLAVAEIDRNAEELRIVRAGHLPPLLVQADATTEWLTPNGIALGMGKDGFFANACEVEKVPFNEGDVIVLYTDGITETLNSGGEEFGDERLRDSVIQHLGQNSEEIRRGLLQDLATFRGAADVTDDVTLVVVRSC